MDMSTHTPAPVIARRQAYRVPFVVEVNIKSDHTFWTGFTHNLSSGGVFLASEKSLPLGSIVQFEMRLSEEGETTLVSAQVRWYRQENAIEGEPGGMGLQFINLDDALRSRIDEFVCKQRETLFFDEEDV
jgi:uncharacterized protein (TIGR02266 family)